MEKAVKTVSIMVFGAGFMFMTNAELDSEANIDLYSGRCAVCGLAGDDAKRCNALLRPNQKCEANKPPKV